MTIHVKVDTCSAVMPLIRASLTLSLVKLPTANVGNLKTKQLKITTFGHTNYWKFLQCLQLGANHSKSPTEFCRFLLSINGHFLHKVSAKWWIVRLPHRQMPDKGIPISHSEYLTYLYNISQNKATKATWRGDSEKAIKDIWIYMPYRKSDKFIYFSSFNLTPVYPVATSFNENFKVQVGENLNKNLAKNVRCISSYKR